jgi:acetyltransferase-like isoleucine patch superfamily enzyme
MKRLLRARRLSTFQRLLGAGTITVGPGTYGEPLVLSWEEDRLTRLDIGAYCSISASVTIVLGGEHRSDWVTTSPLRILNQLAGAGSDGHPRTKGDITIGNDVWIGLGATILSGVAVGDGAVIGAGSVVSSDVPAYAIVAGNPAQLVRYRFSKEIREALQRIRWWNWPREKILDSVGLLCSTEVERFVSLHDPAASHQDQ